MTFDKRGVNITAFGWKIPLLPGSIYFLHTGRSRHMLFLCYQIISHSLVYDFTMIEKNG